MTLVPYYILEFSINFEVIMLVFGKFFQSRMRHIFFAVCYDIMHFFFQCAMTS